MNTQKCISDADLNRLSEGDLTSQEKRTLLEHIKTCPDCKARWEKVCTGSQYIDEMIFETAAKAQGQDQCLTDQQITAFALEDMNEIERQNAQNHLARCPRCREALSAIFVEDYEEGQSWWSLYTAEQLLALFAKLSAEEVDAIASELKAGPVSVRPTSIINLTILKRTAAALAAGTGEGLEIQRLHQDEPAFDFELIKFGEQFRIIAQSREKSLIYQNYLAKLEIIEQERPRFSRVILIEAGQGQCILEPDQIKDLRQEGGDFSLRILPLITREQLDAAGPEVYTAILTKLLEHPDSKIRCGAIEVIARICGLQARTLIEPLAETDKDQMVRETATKALNRIPTIPK